MMWTFTGAVSVERRTTIATWKQFADVVDALATCSVEPMWWEPAYSPPLNGHRASFVLRVGHVLYDAFFNAPIGYRAEFAMSEAQGEAANRKTINRLHPKLIDVARTSPSANLDHVAASLDGQQAKVWIVESEVDAQPADPTPSHSVRSMAVSFA